MGSGPIDVGNVQTFSGYTFDEMLQKMIDAGFNSGGGSSSITSNWPVKSELTLGNNIVWAGNRWIVAHVTNTEAYLVLESVTGQSGTFNGGMFGGSGIQAKCTDFLAKFTQEQTSVLKSVVADETAGLVFCPTRAQYNGGFSWFTSNERRKVGAEYWTSTWDRGGSNDGTWSVTSTGNLSKHTIGNATSDSADFRPAVCVDLTLYDK